MNTEYSKQTRSTLEDFVRRYNIQEVETSQMKFFMVDFPKKKVLLTERELKVVHLVVEVEGITVKRIVSEVFPVATTLSGGFKILRRILQRFDVSTRSELRNLFLQKA